MKAEDFLKNKGLIQEPCTTFIVSHYELGDINFNDWMEDYAKEKVKEFILFYNNRQSKVNTIPLKDEMEIFYDEN